jgi:hypothetical protein
LTRRKAAAGLIVGLALAVAACSFTQNYDRVNPRTQASIRAYCERVLTEGLGAGNVEDGDREYCWEQVTIDCVHHRWEGPGCLISP